MPDSITRETLLASMAPAMKRARRELGLTQDNLAEKLNLTTEFVARIERGRAMPSLENFVNIVDVLNVTADEMLGIANQLPTIPADPLAEAPEAVARLAERIMGLDRLGRAAVNAVLRAMEARDTGRANTDSSD